MYRGPREPQVDYFDDFTNPSSDGGVLKGLGLSDIDRLSQRSTPEGVLIASFSCNQCGKKANMTLDWHEMFVVGWNNPSRPLVLPPGWGYSQANGDCYCQIKCGACPQGVYAPHFTPDAARELVNDAIRKGYIPQAQLQQWEQETRGHAARMSGG